MKGVFRPFESPRLVEGILSIHANYSEDAKASSILAVSQKKGFAGAILIFFVTLRENP